MATTKDVMFNQVKTYVFQLLLYNKKGFNINSNTLEYKIEVKNSNYMAPRTTETLTSVFLGLVIIIKNFNPIHSRRPCLPILISQLLTYSLLQFLATTFYSYTVLIELTMPDLLL